MTLTRSLSLPYRPGAPSVARLYSVSSLSLPYRRVDPTMSRLYSNSVRHCKQERRNVILPPFMRLRDFSKHLGRVNVKKLVTAIGGIRSKKKIYWDDVVTGRSFCFKNIQQMMLPYHTMEQAVKSYWGDEEVNIQMEQVEPKLRSLPIAGIAKDEELVERKPVVAVLGHIDHGKTTLVDSLRNQNTADLEEGGITQAIGAWPVTLDNGLECTFLDTPGHVHFYQMREDSARVATAALLVVACDEPRLGEQTEESINCLIDMDVPVVIAINKCDLVEEESFDACPQRTRMLLKENGVLNSLVGGVAPTVVDISAKEKTNLPQLQDAIAQAVTRHGLAAFGDQVPAEGIVIEAFHSREKGALLRVVISAGVLQVGQPYISGRVVGTVKTLYDEFGKEQISEAWPGQVVYVAGSHKGVGLSKFPPLGEPFFVTSDRKEAERILEYRESVEELQNCLVEGPPLDIHVGDVAQESQLEEDENDDADFTLNDDDNGLPLFVNASSAGKLDALLAALVETEGVYPVRASVGQPRMGDVDAAKSGRIPVVCFGVNPGSRITNSANRFGVPMLEGMVLHELVDKIKAHVKSR